MYFLQRLPFDQPKLETLKRKKRGGNHHHHGAYWHWEHTIDCRSIQWYIGSNGEFYYMHQGGMKHDPRAQKNTKVGYHLFEYVW